MTPTVPTYTALRLIGAALEMVREIEAALTRLCGTSVEIATAVVDDTTIVVVPNQLTPPPHPGVARTLSPTEGVADVKEGAQVDEDTGVTIAPPTFAASVPGTFVAKRLLPPPPGPPYTAVAAEMTEGTPAPPPAHPPPPPPPPDFPSFVFVEYPRPPGAQPLIGDVAVSPVAYASPPFPPEEVGLVVASVEAVPEKADDKGQPCTPARVEPPSPPQMPQDVDDSEMNPKPFALLPACPPSQPRPRGLSSAPLPPPPPATKTASAVLTVFADC